MTRSRLFSLAVTTMVALAGLGVGTAAASIAGPAGSRRGAQPPAGLLLSSPPERAGPTASPDDGRAGPRSPCYGRFPPLVKSAMT